MAEDETVEQRLARIEALCEEESLVRLPRPCDVFCSGDVNFYAFARTELPWLVGIVRDKDKRIAELEGELVRVDAQETADDKLVFDHFNEVIGKMEAENATLRERITLLEGIFLETEGIREDGKLAPTKSKMLERIVELERLLKLQHKGKAL